MTFLVWIPSRFIDRQAPIVIIKMGVIDSTRQGSLSLSLPQLDGSSISLSRLSLESLLGSQC